MDEYFDDLALCAQLRFNDEVEYLVDVAQWAVRDLERKWLLKIKSQVKQEQAEINQRRIQKALELAKWT